MGTESCLTGARYDDKTLPPNNRRIVFFQGNNIKLDLGKDDIESMTEDANGKQQGPFKVRSVEPRSGGVAGRCTLDHLANWERIWLRVRCGHGGWSDWKPVAK